MKRHILTVITLPVLLTACENPLPPVSCAPIDRMDIWPDGTLTRTACFTDPNGDVLTYTVSSNAPATASAVISGTNVTVTGGQTLGTATVTVTATDPGGLTGTEGFGVTTKAPMVLTASSCSASDGVVTIVGRATANFTLRGVEFVGVVGPNVNDVVLVGRDHKGDMSKNENYTITITGRPSRLQTGDRCYLGARWTSVEGHEDSGTAVAIGEIARN